MLGDFCKRALTKPNRKPGDECARIHHRQLRPQLPFWLHAGRYFSSPMRKMPGAVQDPLLR
jgi:hypothetical protein